MGLLENSWTELNKLKFTDDNSGGAKPWIITDIPGANTTPSFGTWNYNSFNVLTGYDSSGNDKSFINLEDINTPPATADFLLRGVGVAQQSDFKDLQNPNLSLGKKIIQDVKRWGKFFISPPGLLFIAKQNLLARLQGKLPKSIKPTRIYNPINTVAQVAGVAFATHLRGKGLLPKESSGGLLGMLGGGGDPDTYDVQTKKIYNSVSSNRLTLLWGSKIFDNDGAFVRDIETSKSNADKFGIDYTMGSEGLLFKYSGGPGSLFGLTNTKIRRFDYTNNWYTNPKGNRSSKNWYALLPYERILGLSKRSSENLSISHDFRKDLIDFPGTNKAAVDTTSDIFKRLTYTNYQKWNREKTYGMGNPGKEGLNRKHPYVGVINSQETVDKINAQLLYQNTTVNQEIADKDIIPFYITIMNNDTPSKNTYIHFRAYLSGINDTYASSWNAHKLMGRGEEFFTYGGFTRNMSLNFKVHAQSRNELNIIYSKLNYLASSLAPDYGNTGFMRGNMIKLTIGDYIVDQPGILKGFTFGIEEGTPWDIGRNNLGEKTDLALPHLINVSSFSFTPIHTFVPSKVSDKWVEDPSSANMKQPFISLGSQTRGYGYTLKNPEETKSGNVNVSNQQTSQYYINNDNKQVNQDLVREKGFEKSTENKSIEEYLNESSDIFQVPSEQGDIVTEE